jgi:nucleotide-binding universal stress UspA family protein
MVSETREQDRGMYERIVVALDGSELAERALAHGEELARRLGAPLHLVRVADVARLRFGANEAAEAYAALGGELAEEEAEAGAYLDAIRARLGERGLAVTTEVRRGTAAREVVEAARPGDLLVLASHGRDGARRWLLGSVAEDVTRRAPAPVLLVRAAPPEGEGRDAPSG